MPRGIVTHCKNHPDRKVVPHTKVCEECKKERDKEYNRKRKQNYEIVDELGYGRLMAATKKKWKDVYYQKSIVTYAVGMRINE